MLSTFLNASTIFSCARLDARQCRGERAEHDDQHRADRVRARRHAEHREELRDSAARSAPREQRRQRRGRSRRRAPSPAALRRAPAPVTLTFEKPSVFITPISLMRSRIDWPIVFAVTSSIVKNTARGDRRQQRADVAHLVGEALDERLLGRGLGLGRGVREHRVDRCARSRPRASGSCDAHRRPSRSARCAERCATR